MAYRPQYVILADGIQPGPMGKWNILGTFDRWWVQDFPTVVAGFTVIALLYGEHEDDLGRHRFALKVLRPNGRIASEITQEVDVKPNRSLAGIADPFGLATVRIILGIQNVPFHEAGLHRVSLEVDGQEVASHPLAVNKGTPNPK